jgi:hypothetical protein
MTVWPSGEDAAAAEALLLSANWPDPPAYRRWENPPAVEMAGALHGGPWAEAVRELQAGDQVVLAFVDSHGFGLLRLENAGRDFKSWPLAFSELMSPHYVTLDLWRPITEGDIALLRKASRIQRPACELALVGEGRYVRKRGQLSGTPL